MRGPWRLRNEIANIPDFWSILRGLHTSQEAASGIFDLLMGIMTDANAAITADNYEFAILALNDFASAGSASASIEQKRERNVRRMKVVKPLAPRLVLHRYR